MEPTPPPAPHQPSAPGTPDEIDIFAWANNLFLYKEKLRFELFLLNKNDIVYRAGYDEALQRQMHALCVDGIVEYVITGAGQGLVVRGFEEAESEDNVLQRTLVGNVEKLAETLTWFGARERDMERFIEEEHDLKRIKAFIVRCTHPDMPEPFFVIKAISHATVLKNAGAWLIRTDSFQPLEGTALRIPADNQLLVIGKELFVFNQSKLERLFGYNAKKHAIARQKAAQIEAHFRLRFDEESSLQNMVKEDKAAINKLQKIDPSAVTQEDLLNHAQELGIELMTDDDGAIIIMNPADLTKFVNLLNDDYIESNLTGVRYEIKSKKVLRPTEEA